MSGVDDAYDGPECTCWQCGGDGRINTGCIDDACVDQDDPYCRYCSRRCDVCGGRGGWPMEPSSSLPTDDGRA